MILSELPQTATGGLEGAQGLWQDAAARGDARGISA